MKNQPIQIHEKNGVTFARESGKWQFKVNTFCLIVSGKTGMEKANKIASAIGASVKRGFAGVEDIDAMARGQIRKIVNAPTYKGIDFTSGY